MRPSRLNAESIETGIRSVKPGHAITPPMQWRFSGLHRAEVFGNVTFPSVRPHRTCECPFMASMTWPTSTLKLEATGPHRSRFAATGRMACIGYFMHYANIRNRVNCNTDYLIISSLDERALPAWRRLGDAMAELTNILIVVACTAWVCIAWVVWTVREFKQALKEAGFDEACGLNDPQFTERRHLKRASV